MPRRLADAMAILALAVAPAAAIAYGLLATPPTILAGALVPPLALALALVLLERPVTRPWTLPLAALLCGAVIATLASAALNEAVLTWLADAAGETHARAYGPALAAPVIEELIKAMPLALLIRAGPPDAVRTGIVLGALVGLGFELTENVQYLMLAALQAGPSGLVRGVWVRSLIGGLDHAVFTATAGAGIGHACAAATARARMRALVLGLGAAIGQHVVWNGVAARAITRVLCNPPQPGAACAPAPDTFGLAVEIPFIAAAALAPGGVVLLSILRRRRTGR